MKELLSVFALMTMVFQATPLPAFWENDKDKAKEYIAAGKNAKAIERLEKRIHDKPTDAEAHFLLGSLYYRKGYWEGAQERFEYAYRLNPEHRLLIAIYYVEEGIAAIRRVARKPPIDEHYKPAPLLRSSPSRTDRTRIEYPFAEAVKYDGSMKKTIARHCVEYGNAFLTAGHNKKAEWLFCLAILYDPFLKKEVKGIVERQGSGPK
jgi:tetratricopeptide (TPR) repeat protein